MRKVELFRKITLWSTGTTLLIGLMILLSWHLRSETLIRLVPGLAAMQYNTALCFLLSGLSLLAMILERPKTGVALALMCGGIVSLTLLQYLSETSFGIDELLMEHYIDLEMLYPGRMSPNTALSFLFSTSAILANTRKTTWTPIGAISALIAAEMGFVSLIGYSFNLNSTYGWGEMPQMAIHTSFVFFQLGIGLTCLNWKSGEQAGLLVEYRKQVLLATLIIVFLFVDLNLPKGVAAGIAYIALPLMGWVFEEEKMPLFLAMPASIMIIFGFFFSPEGSEYTIVVINRFYAMIALWGIAILMTLLKQHRKVLEATNQKLHQQNKEVASASQLVQSVNNELNLANKELEQFVYLVTHDLRAPIRHIGGYAKVLLDPEEELETEEEQQFLQSIKTSGERLERMIADLLSYAHNRNQQINPRVISTREVVGELKQKFSLEYSSRDIRWEIGDLPDCLGDENLLRQVWENLLSNAIKYSSAKPDIHINIWGEQKETETLYVVQDHGAGFDMRHANQLFSIFQRLHAKSEFQGNGIGLANVQRILKLHGGKIWAEGAVNQGATFFFSLPNQVAA